LALTLPTDEDRVHWQAALDELALQMTKATFNSWLREAHLLGRDEAGYVIGVHNQYAKEWLTSRLHDTVARTLTAITRQEVGLRFTVWNPDSDSIRPAGHFPTREYAGR
jgi:chromosomal replication initiator protein